jgi:Stage II sporulation protein E (SpoIIE)
LALLYLFAVLAHAQAHGNSIQDHPTGSAVSNAGVPVLSNPSAVALSGPWKFRTGDSPKVTGSEVPLWAQTNFDDSGWQDYTIDPKHSAATAAEAIQAGALPGWQSHGHPGYTGYAWYRIRFQPPPDTDTHALLMPQYVDEVYEVYLNGRLIGGLGRLNGWHLFHPPQPKLFSIPATALTGGPAITLAVCVWSTNYDALPLGIIEGAEFSVMQFQLAPGDRLMLLSDGIAEAHDKHGQLFGFERIQAMLQARNRCGHRHRRAELRPGR